MNNLIIKLCLTLSLAGMSFAFSTSAFAQSRSVADIASLQGDSRLPVLIEGAKKEGELNIYLAHPSVPLVAAAFTKKYGVKVNVWRSSSENVLQRVLSEANGGRVSVDLVENNAPEMEALHREKLLQEVNSPYMRDLMPQAVPAHREWVGISIDMFTLGYNTRKLKKEDLPKTWQDLLDPKWKGQLGLEAEDHVWFSYVLQSLGEKNGSKLFRDIVSSNGVSVRKGHSLLGQLVASGEVTLALDLYSWGADQFKEKGSPIERFNIGDPIAHFQGLALLKKVPHPHAAVLFFDFMLSDGQEIMSKQHTIATSNKYDQVQKQAPIRFIDPAGALDQNQKHLKVYQDIFLKAEK